MKLNKRRIAVVGLLATLFVMLMAAPAFAADKPVYDGSLHSRRTWSTSPSA